MSSWQHTHYHIWEQSWDQIAFDETILELDWLQWVWLDWQVFFHLVHNRGDTHSKDVIYEKVIKGGMGNQACK